MSNKNSALASLTATYTDSENEDEHNSNDEGSPKTDESSETPRSFPNTSSQSTTPTKPFPQKAQISGVAAKASGKINLRLVSYNDDLVVSDEENVSPNRENINMDISEEEEEVTAEVQDKEQKSNKPPDKCSEYGFALPPEPKGKCSQELQDKIIHMYEKMKNGMDMNKVIQERKEFRNPSIYEKLIQFCDINELGTNYPPEIYDPLQWGKESFYEELAKAQKVEMEKREKERKEHMKQDMVVNAAKKSEEDGKKRKSKWDQPAPGATAQTNKAGGVVQATFTTNATGTKGTVISAFGSLPKKPKV